MHIRLNIGDIEKEKEKRTGEPETIVILTKILKTKY